MNPNLLAALIKELGLPEFLRWLASHKNEIITDETVKAELKSDTETAIIQGSAWLDSKK